MSRKKNTTVRRAKRKIESKNRGWIAWVIFAIVAPWLVVLFLLPKP